MKNLRLSALLLVLMCLGSASTFAAEDDGVNSSLAFGLRAGYTNWDNLDQFHFGAHLKVGEILPNVFFTPNVELSFGSAANIYIFNADVAYSFTEFVSSPWNLYGGGAFSLNFVKFDGIDTDSSIGLSALIGLEYALSNGHQTLVELRAGLMDSPDLKLTFGYTFF